MTNGYVDRIVGNGLVLFLGIAIFLVSCSGSFGPTEAEFEKKIQESLPIYLEPVKSLIKVTKVDEARVAKFEIEATARENLYVKIEPGEELKPIMESGIFSNEETRGILGRHTYLKKVQSKGTVDKYYGAMGAKERVDGSWEFTTVHFENLSPNDPKPIGYYKDSPLDIGSEEYKELVNGIIQKRKDIRESVVEEQKASGEELLNAMKEGKIYYGKGELYQMQYEVVMTFTKCEMGYKLKQ